MRLTCWWFVSFAARAQECQPRIASISTEYNKEEEHEESLERAEEDKQPLEGKSRDAFAEMVLQACMYGSLLIVILVRMSHIRLANPCRSPNHARWSHHHYHSSYCQLISHCYYYWLFRSLTKSSSSCWCWKGLIGNYECMYIQRFGRLNKNVYIYINIIILYSKNSVVALIQLWLSLSQYIVNESLPVAGIAIIIIGMSNVRE